MYLTGPNRRTRQPQPAKAASSPGHGLHLMEHREQHLPTPEGNFQALQKSETPGEGIDYQHNQPAVHSPSDGTLSVPDAPQEGPTLLTAQLPASPTFQRSFHQLRAPTALHTGGGNTSQPCITELCLCEAAASRLRLH